MGTRVTAIGTVMAGLLAGCLGASEGAPRCEGALVAEGTACVMTGHISETGFDCPPLMPYEYGGEFGGEMWVLCSSEGDLDGAQVEASMREGGRPDRANVPDDNQLPGHDDPRTPDDHSGPAEDCVDEDGDGICGDEASEAACGDMILDPGEECDDGNNMPGDDCSPRCTIEGCANGVLDDGEQCDDGNNIGGDGCSPRCTIEECGNGVLDAGEECDDGNSMNTDGCSASCASEDVPCIDSDGDGLCEEDDEDPSEQGDATSCGDGVLDAGEACDDGNLMNFDGCNTSCQLEGAGCDEDGDGVCDP